ncbi:hypothetical protein [Actinoplanes palleronii]|uniref:Uncharacterized protein n=1 Tax=Actinoplanes palleronii TaxID=113570 RepID=A0ABQ4BHF1_9ACTN|nr:hypothetical protein [Actinoplanes palleronii]GIE70111.1 hypothetical protein Apa02nite_062190 [Actinoplanes palleronii]
MAHGAGWRLLTGAETAALTGTGPAGGGRPAVSQWNDELRAGHPATAAFAVLHGTAGDVPGWLRAGEALSGGWLAATRLDVAVLPLSAPVVDTRIGDRLRSMAGDLGQVYLALRLTRDSDGARSGTPRLPARQLISRG